MHPERSPPRNPAALRLVGLQATLTSTRLPSAPRAGCNLVEARGLAKVQSLLDLRQRQAPAQTAGQFRLADALPGHRLVDARPGACQGRRAHRGTARGGERNRPGAAGRDQDGQGGFQGVDRVAQRLVFVVAHRAAERQVRKTHRYLVDRQAAGSGLPAGFGLLFRRDKVKLYLRTA
jgi:hypothetical protein